MGKLVSSVNRRKGPATNEPLAKLRSARVHGRGKGIPVRTCSASRACTTSPAEPDWAGSRNGLGVPGVLPQACSSSELLVAGAAPASHRRLLVCCDQLDLPLTPRSTGPVATHGLGRHGVIAHLGQQSARVVVQPVDSSVGPDGVHRPDPPLAYEGLKEGAQRLRDGPVRPSQRPCSTGRPLRAGTFRCHPFVLLSRARAQGGPDCVQAQAGTAPGLPSCTTQLASVVTAPVRSAAEGTTR